MTIHFAAARSPLAALVNPARHKRITARAANDNSKQNGSASHSAELRAALRHFAEHGLGAATVARQNAERAFFSGDRRGYLHWLGICRTLDRRMANVLATSVDTGND